MLFSFPIAQWLPWIFFTVLFLYAIHYGQLPSIHSWQKFCDSFESKGAQLLLLWVTDGIVLGVTVLFWKKFDSQLQTTIVGLLSGINGAFLGAIGARQTSNAAQDTPPASQPSPRVARSAAQAAPLPPANPSVVPFGANDAKT